MIRTRFAPSPTGFLHIGGLRTAAYAYALAKHSGGKFILRIEDTDQKREVAGAKEKICEILKVFDLVWDEGPHVQSERLHTGIYQTAAEKLLAQGNAFYCFCKPQDKAAIQAEHAAKRIQFRDPCRILTTDQINQKLTDQKPAIRLKVPDHEKISYFDFVINKQNEWQTDYVDDAMLLKSDGFPTYHLAMPVDDHDMGITHVIRSSEWQPSTPIHLLVFKYLGYDLPQIGHPTAILDPAGGKLSKRNNNVSVEQFLAEGYLKEALLNFVILLGWAPKDNQELFTLKEFVDKFDEHGFQKSNPRLNLQKLLWFNKQYLRRTSDQELLELVKPHIDYPMDEKIVLQILPLVKERVSVLNDIPPLIKFLFVTPKISPDVVPYQQYLPDIQKSLQQTDWQQAAIETSLLKVVETKQYPKADFFMGLRLAVCGQRVTPPLTESMLILGKPEVLSRVHHAQKQP